MTTLRIGIASYEQMKARSLAIARGEHKPGRREPRIWFTSMDSVARVLSDRNRALLDLIARVEPNSLTELAALTGRAQSNLSRTLKTMERYGLVNLHKGAGGRIRPRVTYTDIVLDVPIGARVGVAA